MPGPKDIPRQSAPAGPRREGRSTLFSLRRIVVGGLAFFIVPLVAMSLICWNDDAPPPTKPDLRRPVPADAIIPAYRLDREGSEAHFENKRFTVLGKVNGVRLLGREKGYLLIHSDNGNIAFEFTEKRRLEEIYPGDVLLVSGLCVGLGREDAVSMRESAIEELVARVDRDNAPSASRAERRHVGTYRLRIKALTLAAIEARQHKEQAADRYLVELLEANNTRAFHFRIVYATPQEDLSRVAADLEFIVESCRDAIFDSGRNRNLSRLDIQAIGLYPRFDMPRDQATVYGIAAYQAESDAAEFSSGLGPAP